jgi:hypothetical protein
MAAQAVAPSNPGTASEPPSLCVEILGASVSAGFVDSPMAGGSRDNASTPLLVPFRRWLEGAEAKVNSRADALMFLDAPTKARAQAERAAKSDPHVVVAVDYLFWFGYGTVEVELAAGLDVEAGEAKARLSRLREGLQTIDALPCPIVLGDLPDMRGASRRMLRAGQIPSVECLQEMNREIAAWAKERPRVRVFPLAKLVAEMKDRGVRLPLEGGELATKPGALLQSDRLHATRLGVAYLACLLEPEVRAALPEDRRASLPAATFADFCGFAGAEVELADMQHGAEAESKAKQPEKSGGR